ncbi:FAD-dependent oxidoreductase [Streptomyces sp. B1866]|uniref:FAD-dependent oxidoreductase n=1 Tax=Streptomyces sp. B1866 TaxID=3075431 RepID=UPI00288CF9FB|nr:FAD-dependent oxidoreductase [Streptomyces sp. B1866]MDT3396481.1 FAD-dependent oxidoreductase [Streptomyces sp. B1866]
MTNDDRAVILLVHADTPAGAELTDQVAAYFGGRYRVLRAADRADAELTLASLRRDGVRVAAVLADERFEEDSGAEFLTEPALDLPEKGRVLLAEEPERAVAVRDMDVRVAPREPEAPEDLLDTVEDVLFDTRDITAPSAIVYGDRNEETFFTVHRFLRLNFVTCKTQPKTEDAKVRVELTVGGKPRPFTDPALLDLANALGLVTYKESTNYDLVVVGGGPAGMSAALNAAALFKLKVLIVEKFAPGGEAGTAINLIENYLGFPDGIQPYELAHLWKKQLDKPRFKDDIHWLPCHSVSKMDWEKTTPPVYTLTFAANTKNRDIGTTVKTKMVLVTIGVKPKRLDPGTKAQDFEWKGVYYDALPSDYTLYDAKTDRVAIVGGGDTAGRAAVMFAMDKKDDKGNTISGIPVDMIIRGKYGADMLKDVQDAISPLVQSGKIKIRDDNEVKLVTQPQAGKLRLTFTKSTDTLDVSALYVLIGGQADTRWLADAWVKLTEEGPNKGCVKTGKEAGHEKSTMESTLPGVFAAGDVRDGAVRRISAAVGEGGAAAISIYNYTKSLQGRSLNYEDDEDSPTRIYYSLSDDGSAGDDG